MRGVGRLTSTTDSHYSRPQLCARSGGQSRVLADQAVHPRKADDWTAGNRAIRGGRPRRARLQTAMGSEPVVVHHVLGQDRLQLSPAHDQEPVQALATGTGDPALAPGAVAKPFTLRRVAPLQTDDRAVRMNSSRGRHTPVIDHV